MNEDILDKISEKIDIKEFVELINSFRESNSGDEMPN